MVINYVPFAEAVIEIVVELYRSTAKFPSVIHGHVLQRIINVRPLQTYYIFYFLVRSVFVVLLRWILQCVHEKRPP